MESDQGERSFSVVIPNRFEDVIKPLLESIELYEPTPPRIMIVANGHDNNYGYESVTIPVRKGLRFNFARAVNAGIKAVEPDDVIVMNDDVRLLESGTFDTLSKMAYSDSDIGLISPLVDGGCGNLFMRQSRTDLWEDLPSGLHFCCARGGDRVTFACVYMKRSMLNSIGLFDEKFTSYGYDDADMCIRAVKQHWKVAITNRATVQHGVGGEHFVRGQNWSTSFKRIVGENYKASLIYIRRKHPDFVR